MGDLLELEIKRWARATTVDRRRCKAERSSAGTLEAVRLAASDLGVTMATDAPPVSYIRNRHGVLTGENFDNSGRLVAPG